MHYGEGKCCAFFRRGRRRYAPHFTAVGAAFYTTATVNAARFLAVSADFTAVGAAFYTTATVNAGHFLAVSVGVMPPTLLLLVRPFTLRRG